MNYRKFLDTKYTVLYLALLMNLLVLRVCIPFLEYLFIVFGFLLLPILVFNFKKKLKELSNWRLLKSSMSFMTLIILMIIGYIRTEQHTFLVIRELAISIFALVYIIIGSVLLNKKTQIKVLFTSFTLQFIFITQVAAILGILKLTLEFLGIKFSFLLNPGYPIGSSLKSDHNFFALSMIIGFIMSLHRFYYYKPKANTKYSLILIIYTISIFLSSSRRAIIIIIIIHAILIIQTVFYLAKKRSLPRTKKYILIIFALGIATLVTLNFNRKSKIFSFKSKQKFSIIFNDYRSIIIKNSNFKDTYKVIWQTDYLKDLNDYNIKNNNNQNVLFGTKESNNFENSPFWRIWHMSAKKLYKINDVSILEIRGFDPKAALYHFLSLDSIEHPLEISMNIKVGVWNKGQGIEFRWGNNSQRLNISDSINDGKWHQISIKLSEIENTKIQMIVECPGISINQESCLYLNNIKISHYDGASIPDHKILKKLNTIKLPKIKGINTKAKSINVELENWENNFVFSNATTNNAQNIYITYSDNQRQSMSKNIIIPKSQFYIFSSKVLVYSPLEQTQSISVYSKFTDYTFYSSFQNSIFDNKWHNLKIIFFAEKNDTIKLSAFLNTGSAGQMALWKDFQLATYEEFHNKSGDVTQMDTLTKKELKAIYLKTYKMVIKENLSKKNKFIFDRFDRWKYAIFLFNNYKLFDKIFGAGFDYLINFKKEFQKRNEKEFDYPHNIFLSTILYSGFIGLIVLLYVLIKTISIYILNKQYILLISFLLTSMFVLVSSDSIFELPLFVSFITLPYLQQLVIDKEKQSINN